MTFRASVLALLVTLGVGALAGCSGQAAGRDDAASLTSAIDGGSIASLALANVGRGACSTNSDDGSGYGSSCHGNGGQPEYWCADFALWVWSAAGVGNLDGLSPAAGSFYVYGVDNGTLSNTPHVGDAVVFDYQGGGVADHVAIVTQVVGNSIVTVSGDWGGHGSSEAAFSSTSAVVLNSPAYAGVVGSYPDIMGMTISGFISPVGLAGAPPGAPPSCNVGGVEGTCIDTGTCAGKSGYHSTAGYCPGADNIECCTPDASAPPPPAAPTACSVDGVSGTCIDTGTCAGKSGYHSTAGYCPGADDIECCTPDASAPPPSSSPDACSQGDGFCTATLQCDSGHWIVRQDDPDACSTVDDVSEPCAEGDGYCTATLQCDGGHWVPRSDDPAACTSGPGA